jgi:hypothetical protein
MPPKRVRRDATASPAPALPSSSSSVSSNVLAISDYPTGLVTAIAAVDVLSFINSLTDRHVSLALVADGTLRTSGELRLQIKHPLKLINAAAWFFAMQGFLPVMKPHWEEHPLRHIVWEPGMQFPPSVLVLLMCCCATASRLATAPAGLNVMIRKTMKRWGAWIMERVLRGRVRRVQVLLHRRACCGVLRAARIAPVPNTCALCLTRAAANTG